MDIFDVLKLIGGLSLFLFGMSVMGQALERRAGNGLRMLLGKMTTNRLAGFLTGCGVTSVIQSSSATTVMVVGFVNSGLMSLRQAINVIMGANVGTTITAWILSLSGINSNNIWVSLLKPTSFTPVLALIGVIILMFSKKNTGKDTGTVLLGFATLMFGMDTMSAAVVGLSEVEQFRQAFVMFTNPMLGLAVGAILTAIIQSSSASVGILQALALTGQMSYGAAIPIIMGQNIGTCITAIISSIGANKSAKRAAFVHLSFNVIGSVVLLSVFSIVKAVFAPAILSESASAFGIAVAHSAFNILCVLILMPMSSLLEKAAMLVIKDDKNADAVTELDERLLATPPLALDRCKTVACEMAECSVRALKNGMLAVTNYSAPLAESVRRDEELSDKYEDVLGTYLVKLSSQKMSDADSEEATELLKIIGDFERISDHGVNVLESAEEMRNKKLTFSESAVREYETLKTAVCEATDLALEAFKNGNVDTAAKVEPLEQVIDDLKEEMRTRHIKRMQKNDCGIEVGFVWSDLITNLERASDHCSNIAGCVIDTANHNLNLHMTLREAKKNNNEYNELYDEYSGKYALS